MEPQTLPTALILVIIPVAFVGIWLLVTTMIWLISGWPGLSARFPDRDEPPLATFRLQSGLMGGMARMRNALTFSPCRTGLRVGIMRLLAPFSRPFFVPWSELKVERRQRFMGPTAVLSFGQPAAGTLEISASLADRLLAHQPGYKAG
jgi:hypothetical protein